MPLPLRHFVERLQVSLVKQARAARRVKMMRVVFRAFAELVWPHRKELVRVFRQQRWMLAGFVGSARRCSFEWLTALTCLRAWRTVVPPNFPPPPLPGTLGAHAFHSGD